MSKNESGKKRNLIAAIFQHKCPHCREGNMFQHQSSYSFKGFMKMNEHCPVCNQRTEIEPGFYYGTGYISYVLTVAFSVTTFVAWWVLIGVSVDDNRVFWWLGSNAFLLIVFQPYLMRLSRVIWLSFFVSYNANWVAEKDAGAFT